MVLKLQQIKKRSINGLEIATGRATDSPGRDRGEVKQQEQHKDLEESENKSELRKKNCLAFPHANIELSSIF
jgi:hypothetical protein